LAQCFSPRRARSWLSVFVTSASVFTSSIVTSAYRIAALAPTEAMTRHQCLSEPRHLAITWRARKQCPARPPSTRCSLPVCRATAQAREFREELLGTATD
jgi:hypothetical protein